MPGTYFWNKLYLHRYKVGITLLLIVCALSGEAQRTRWVRTNNPNYDNKKLSYGFLIGLHTTAYQVAYSDSMVTQQFDTVHSVVPDWKKGFSLGFIVNYKLSEFFDLRLTPTVAFYEYTLRYIYTDNTPTDVQPIETTMVEFPILLKYKSERRDNIRMYMIGGIKPGIEASGKKAIENSSSSGVKVKGTNLCLEAGFGFDLYYPLFKFSPEIRFSRGVVNMLENNTNKYGKPLERLNTNTITLFLLFQ